MSIEITKSYSAYKKSPYKSIKHSSYFPVYDHLFCPYIGKEITLDRKNYENYMYA